MLAEGADGFLVAGIERGKKGFGLLTEVIEIGTGRKALGHETFSMFAPGSASRRHEERAIGFVFFEMKLGYTLPADPVADFQPLI